MAPPTDMNQIIPRQQEDRITMETSVIYAVRAEKL
jgi:hypothetical protein